MSISVLDAGSAMLCILTDATSFLKDFIEKGGTDVEDLL